MNLNSKDRSRAKSDYHLIEIENLEELKQQDKLALGPQVWKSEESRLLHRLPVLDIDLVNGLAAVVLHLILAFSCLVDFEVVLDFEFFVIVGSIVVDGALDSEDRDWIGIVRLGGRTWRAFFALS